MTRHHSTVHGVDGCRGGWIRASLALGADYAPTALAFALHERFADCLAATAGETLAVDIPIGLLDAAVPGGRPCDRAARRALGWPRRTSVFSPPARPALAARDYREASRRNGLGMTQEAFRILAKIREVDAAVTPGLQARVHEAHPELAFMRLAGAGIGEPKRTPAGRARRHALLASALGLSLDVDATRARLGRARVAADDVLDAAVLTLTARHVRAATAHDAGAGERDGRGLAMTIRY